MFAAHARLSQPTLLSRLAAVAALAGCVVSAPAQAAYLYTFTFDALPAVGGPAFSAATIVYGSDTLAVANDALNLVSGSINGCAPSQIFYNEGATPATYGGFETSTFPLCTDGPGPGVDGLFFRPDTEPLGVGMYTTAANAGRFFIDELSGGGYRYTSGTLTITDLDANGVPEPGTLALVGLSMAGMCGLWRMRRRPA